MIRIRYHHLMCIPRFRGEGYSAAFCRNMAEIQERIKHEHYELVDTADDICRYCPNLTDGICADEEKVNRYDGAVRKALDAGIDFTPHIICPDCKWFSICSRT